MSGTPVRVLTWNVHSCVGSDGIFDPDRIIRLVQSLAPDILALQEIEARITAGRDLFVYFEERMGWISAGARTLETAHGHYGHMLLSRWPMDRATVLDLSRPRREPRLAILGAVRAPGARIEVIATHLGLASQERRYQIARLRASIDLIQTRPIIVLGDFNEIRRHSLAERTFCPPLEPTKALPTYPSRYPLFALDRIWYSRPLELLDLRVVTEGRLMSDHLPLLADLKLPC